MCCCNVSVCIHRLIIANWLTKFAIKYNMYNVSKTNFTFSTIAKPLYSNMNNSKVNLIMGLFVSAVMSLF